MNQEPWKDDETYMAHVGNLIDQPAVTKLRDITHHYNTTRFHHSARVSYTSYKITKKLGWNHKATARAGLLHDLFYYDWRDTKFDKGTHAWNHPRIAVKNASKLTKLSKLEKDIILKHMWGATIAPPRYKESFVVTFVDKYWAVREWAGPAFEKWRHRRQFRRTQRRSALRSHQQR
jgi:uncharacterized protein